MQIERGSDPQGDERGRLRHQTQEVCPQPLSAVPVPGPDLGLYSGTDQPPSSMLPGFIFHGLSTPPLQSASLQRPHETPGPDVSRNPCHSPHPPQEQTPSKIPHSGYETEADLHLPVALSTQAKVDLEWASQLRLQDSAAPMLPPSIDQAISSSHRTPRTRDGAFTLRGGLKEGGGR